MNEFDKRMADLQAERRRQFWADFGFWVMEIVSWAAVVVLLGAIAWFW